jgi:hypothetical protein
MYLYEFLVEIFSQRRVHRKIFWLNWLFQYLTEKENPAVQNEQLVGAWKLVSFEARSSNGEVSYPYGRNAFGMLMYDAGGNVFVLLMRRDRPKFASDDLWRGTPEEIKAAFEGFVAYCGTYEVDEEKGTVTHHVEGSHFPNWAGTDQVRLFKCSGDQLTLSTPPTPLGGRQSTVHFIWARTRK